MIRSFKHKGRAELFEPGRSRRVRQDLQRRCVRRLAFLDHAESLTDLHVPEFNFHRLQGVPTRDSIHVNGPWCITFEWEDGEALRVDVAQDHCGDMRAEYTVQRPLRRPPIHLGEVVRADVLPALGLSVSEAARRLGVSLQQWQRMFTCTHPITAEMALRIGRLAGHGSGLWRRLQQAHDVWHTEQRLKEELAQITPAAPVSSGA